MPGQECRCAAILDTMRESIDPTGRPPACPAHGFEYLACRACGDYTTTIYCSRQCAERSPIKKVVYTDQTGQQKVAELPNLYPGKVIEIPIEGGVRSVEEVQVDPFAEGFRNGVVEGYKQAIEAVRARARYMSKAGYTVSSVAAVNGVAYWLENQENRPKEKA